LSFYATQSCITRNLFFGQADVKKRHFIHQEYWEMPEEQEQESSDRIREAWGAGNTTRRVHAVRSF
jgi:hypothetical protein